LERIKAYPNPPAPDFSCDGNTACAFPHSLGKDVPAVSGLKISTVKTDVCT